MIRVEDAATGVRTITLARPDKRNALTPEMLRAITTGATHPPPAINAIAITGEGKAFCAGFDLRAHPHQRDHAFIRELISELSHTILALRSCPVPVVMGIHGSAIAGGCALLGGADLVLAERSTRLGYPVLRLGISPAVSAPFLRLATPDGPSRALLLDPELISAAHAHRIGLVHELINTNERLHAHTLARASALASKPPAAIRTTKAWLTQIDGLDESVARDAAEASIRALTDETYALLEQEIWNR